MATHAFYNETTKDLVIDEEGTSHDGYTDLGALPTNANSANEWPWDSVRSEILTATVISISGVTSTAFMFAYCPSLTSLDLSSFDTSSVTNMMVMFSGCSALTSLDLSSFDTSNMKKMYSMFYECSGLTSLDISSFDTSNVTDMSSIFAYCSGLTSLDLSSFDTSSATKMYSMFEGCSGLTSLDVSSFDTSSVTDMHNMFRDCYSLMSLDLSSFDTSRATSSASLFADSSNLTIIDISNSMKRILSQLPKSSYYPVSGGDPVAKTELTAGTWVSDPAILDLASSIVHVRQGINKQKHRINELQKKSYSKEEVYTKAEVDALIKQAQEAIYAGLQNSLSINEQGQLVLDLPDEV